MVEIKTILIFEMLGRPPDHLKETLHKFVDKISGEEGVEIINKKINDPKKIEEAQQEIYTSFAEVEADFIDMSSLMRVIFVYMPSHIEITSPANISIQNSNLNELMNELTRKMHQYDELAKRLIIEKQILEKQFQQVINQGNLNKVEEVKEEKAGKKKAAKKPRKQSRKNKDNKKKSP